MHQPLVRIKIRGWQGVASLCRTEHRLEGRADLLAGFVILRSSARGSYMPRRRVRRSSSARHCHEAS
eukprot:scaffold1002_cov117-Isochrysis_galbana.AAC.2